MPGKHKQTTPFLPESQGATGGQLSPPRPLHLPRPLLCLQTVPVAQLPLIMPPLSHPQRIPQTGCFPLGGAGQRFESKSISCHFLPQHLSAFSPFLPHWHFLQFSLVTLLSTCPLLFSSAILKESLLTHCRSPGAYLENIISFRSLSCQESSWVMFFTQLTEIFNINSWPFSELLLNIVPSCWLQLIGCSVWPE